MEVLNAKAFVIYAQLLCSVPQTRLETITLEHSIKGVLTPKSRVQRTNSLHDVSKMPSCYQRRRRLLGTNFKSILLRQFREAGKWQFGHSAPGGMRQRSFQPIKLQVVGPFPLSNMHISRKRNRQALARQKLHRLNLLGGHVVSSFVSFHPTTPHLWAASDQLNVAGLIPH